MEKVPVPLFPLLPHEARTHLKEVSVVPEHEMVADLDAPRDTSERPVDARTDVREVDPSHAISPGRVRPGRLLVVNCEKQSEIGSGGRRVD